MRELIDAHIRDASLRRTVPAIVRQAGSAGAEPEQLKPPKPVVSAEASKASSSPRAALASSGMIGNTAPATGGDPIQPLLVKHYDQQYRSVPDRAAAAATSATAEALPQAGD